MLPFFSNHEITIFFTNINLKAEFVERVDHLSIFQRHFNKILVIKTVTIFPTSTMVRRRNLRNFKTSLRVYQSSRTQDQSQKTRKCNLRHTQDCPKSYDYLTTILRFYSVSRTLQSRKCKPYAKPRTEIAYDSLTTMFANRPQGLSQGF